MTGDGTRTASQGARRRRIAALAGVGATIAFVACLQPTGRYYDYADAVPPEVVDVYPENLASGIALDVTFRVTFSEPMDRVTVKSAVKLSRGDAAVDYAALEPDGGPSNVFGGRPFDALSPKTAYDLTVGAEARDLAGNGLKDGGEVGVRFTTGP